MKNCILLIVMYNNNFDESMTLKSLCDSDYDGELLIFNNGPRLLSEENDFFTTIKKRFSTVTLTQDLSNRPLSVIYNDFILSNKGYSKYFLFDDDTNIAKDFFMAKDINHEYDISLPVIISLTTNNVFYPLINGKEYSPGQDLNENDYVISIGSGLMISHSLVDKFKKNEIKPFDERFALYGVDFSLFRRMDLIKSRGDRIKIDISGELKHSLSRVDEKKTKSRELERLIDVVLTKIHYPKRSHFLSTLSIMKIFVARLLCFDVSGACLLIKIMVLKAHPRTVKFKYRW